MNDIRDFGALSAGILAEVDGLSKNSGDFWGINV